MTILLITSEDQKFVFQSLFQSNSLLTIYTVYQISYFLRDDNEAYNYISTSVNLLVPEICFWPANTTKNLIFWRCLEVLELLHKVFSDMIEEKWWTSSFPYFPGDFSWMVNVGMNFLHLKLMFLVATFSFCSTTEMFTIIIRNLLSTNGLILEYFVGICLVLPSSYLPRLKLAGSAQICFCFDENKFFQQ